MSTDPTRELHQLRVGVLHPADREIDELLRHLKRIGCQTEWAWPPPASLPAEIRVVFFAIAPEGPQVALPRLADPEPALIAIVDCESPSAVKSLLDSNAHSFITKPIRPGGILSSLVIARSQHGYQTRLTAKVAKLEETLRSRREIERATRILMEMKRLDEDGAYQLIRAQATAQRMSMGVVARSIITAHRVFDTSARNAATDSTTRAVLKMPARNLLDRTRR
jgi:AmiR/NasT family two-component response regulator